MINKPKPKESNWIVYIFLAILVVFIIVPSLITYQVQEWRMANALEEQKNDYLNQMKSSEQSHQQEIANIQLQKEENDKKNLSTKVNLSSEIEKLKTDHENELKTISQNKTNEINSLHQQYKQLIKDQVAKEGFYFVFGSSPNEKNKQKIQSYIDEEFAIALSQKCYLSLNIYTEGINRISGQESLNRLNQKLASMRTLANNYKFTIIKEDEMLTKNIKNWGKPNYPIKCFN